MDLWAAAGLQSPSERRAAVEAAAQAELVRAYLAGYWQAVEDFRIHAGRRRRGTADRPSYLAALLRRQA